MPRHDLGLMSEVADPVGEGQRWGGLADGKAGYIGDDQEEAREKGDTVGLSRGLQVIQQQSGDEEPGNEHRVQRLAVGVGDRPAGESGNE